MTARDLAERLADLGHAPAAGPIWWHGVCPVVEHPGAQLRFRDSHRQGLEIVCWACRPTLVALPAWLAAFWTAVENRPVDDQADTEQPEALTEAEQAAAWLRRRQQSAWRLPPLPDGRRDPDAGLIDAREAS